MTLEDMREFISGKYPSRAWRRRVMNMSETQVLAIYSRVVEEPTKEPAPEIQLRLF